MDATQGSLLTRRMKSAEFRDEFLGGPWRRRIDVHEILKLAAEGASPLCHGRKVGRLWGEYRSSLRNESLEQIGAASRWAGALRLRLLGCQDFGRTIMRVLGAGQSLSLYRRRPRLGRSQSAHERRGVSARFPGRRLRANDPPSHVRTGE